MRTAGALGLLAALTAAGCGAGSNDAQAGRDVKSAFADAKKPMDQLSPAQRTSKQQMLDQAAQMAGRGPSGASGTK